MRFVHRHGALGASLVVPLTVICACANPTAEPSATPQTPTSSVPESTGPGSPGPESPSAESPSAESPTPTEITPPDGEQSLSAALLPAGLLPPLTSATPWRRAPRSTSKVSVCQRVSLPSIGATRIARRDYRVAGSEITASQVVAAFPDELTAGYGFDILQAWLRTCAKRLEAAGFDRADVPSSYTTLDLADRAGWTVFFYGPVEGDPNAAHIQAEALVLDGKHLSWVVERSIGQDYNYEAGDTPPERAASLMGDRLSGLAASA